MRVEEVAQSLAERIERTGMPRAKDDLVRPGSAIAVNGNGNHIHYNTVDEGQRRRFSTWNRFFGLVFTLCMAVSMAFLWRSNQPPSHSGRTPVIQRLLLNQNAIDGRQPLEGLLAAVVASVVVSDALTLAVRSTWAER